MNISSVCHRVKSAGVAIIIGTSSILPTKVTAQAIKDIFVHENSVEQVVKNPTSDFVQKGKTYIINSFKDLKSEETVKPVASEVKVQEEANVGVANNSVSDVSTNSIKEKKVNKKDDKKSKIENIENYKEGIEPQEELKLTPPEE